MNTVDHAKKLMERVRGLDEMVPLPVALLCDLVPELVAEIESLRERLAAVESPAVGGVLGVREGQCVHVNRVHSVEFDESTTDGRVQKVQVGETVTCADCGAVL